MQLRSCSSSYSNHRVRHLSYCKSPRGQDAKAHVLLRLSVATPCRSTHSCACCQMPSERSCDGACCCLCLLAIHVMSATPLCMCSVKPLRSVCLFACVAELRGCGTPELWCRSAGNWCVREAVATPHSLVWCSYTHPSAFSMRSFTRSVSCAFWSRFLQCTRTHNRLGTQTPAHLLVSHAPSNCTHSVLLRTVEQACNSRPKLT